MVNKVIKEMPPPNVVIIIFFILNFYNLYVCLNVKFMHTRMFISYTVHYVI